MQVIRQSTKPFDLARIRVQAFSIGGQQTCIDLPGLRTAFDLGCCPPWLVKRARILFTHGHIDHMGAVATHAARRALFGMQPATYVVPAVYRSDLEDLLAVWRKLDGSELPAKIEALELGEDYRIHRDLVARPYLSPHRAPCQGYVLWRQVHRLLKEFQGRTPEELAELKRDGQVIESLSETPLVAFSGDSSITGFDHQPALARARLLIHECTFLDDRVSAASAHEMGHTHLDDIVARASAFENEALLLTHFSARYRPQEIINICEERLPPELALRTALLLSTFTETP